MRRWRSIAQATALEILSEPLSLLLLLAALAVATFAPAFHYHQFGEATRIARDAGFSALFTCGTLFAVFGVLRSIRREIETGTAQMALAHPVSRTCFFVSKLTGAIAAYLAFALIVCSVALVMTRGCEIGGEIAREKCDIAKVWGPSFSLAVASLIVPLVVGAALNRFGRFRFVLTYFVTALLVSTGSTLYAFNLELLARLLPVAMLILLPSCVLLAATATFSVRFKANAAASLVALVFAAMLPCLGNYYLPDALTNGAWLAWSYVGWAAGAAAPAFAAFVAWGILLINGRDLA